MVGRPGRSAEMGAGDLLQKEVIWTLTSLDRPGTGVEGQFRPSNLTENVSGAWAEVSTLGLQQPILQFMRGNLETISFDAKIWAKHSGVLGTGLGSDNIKQIVDNIRNLPRADPTLGRPHVFTFTWSEEFQQDVVVRSVGGIRYDHARPESMLGSKPSSLRGVMFRMDLARYVEYDVAALVGASESLIIYAKQGDTFEIIAKRLYGDAKLGEVLRRRNPESEVLGLTEGDRLHILPKVTARHEYSPKRQSLALKKATAQTALFNAVLDKRSVSRRSHVFHGDV
jgi:hypothetical protein